MASAANVAIRTERLSKRYVLGGSAVFGYATIAESIANLVRGPRRPKVEAPTLWALRDVSIEIEQGETVAFIGRNGAGKSTLLKILSRITRPTEGHATLHGRVGSLLEVGTGFHGELTGRENVYLNGVLLGLTRREIDRRFDEIVAFAEVEDFLDTPVKRYSSGMTVRLAFSVAAHLEPEILLVDEVLAVGDFAFQRKCLGKMNEVASAGRTVVFVSHNMAVVQALCRRGIYLEHGSVQTDAPIAVAVADYLRALEDKAEVQDISERVDRRGEQGVRVQTIDIRDQSGSQTIASGAAVEITVGLSRTIRRAGCEILIYDQLGHPVTKLSSHRAGPEDVLAHQNEPRFECHIDELLLVPGRYRIDLEVYGRGSLQDLVEGAAYFDVVDGLVRGRPISIADSTGHLIQPVRWTSPDAE
jgi:lipopolysaccharide transport system ATP-binding protein